MKKQLLALLLIVPAAVALCGEDVAVDTTCPHKFEISELTAENLTLCFNRRVAAGETAEDVYASLLEEVNRHARDTESAEVLSVHLATLVQ